MKKAFFAFLVIFFISGAYGLNMNVPPEIPGNVSWSFWIEFDSLDFSEARVFLDSSQIAGLDIYHGELSIVPDSVNETFALSIVPSGKKAFVSMAGLSEGSHEIRAEVFRDSEKIDESIVSITAFESLGKDYQSGIDQSIASIEANINSFAVEINELKASIEELKTGFADVKSNVDSKLPGFEQALSDASNAVTNFEQKLGNMDGELGYLAKDLEEVRKEYFAETQKQKSVLDNLLGVFGPESETNVSQENQEISEEPLAEENQENSREVASGTGFVSAGNALSLGIIIVIAVFAVLIVINIARQRGIIKSTDSQEGFDNISIRDSIEEQRRGKWSFEEETEQKPLHKTEKQETKGKRFSLGDLIKNK